MAQVVQNTQCIVKVFLDSRCLLIKESIYGTGCTKHSRLVSYFKTSYTDPLSFCERPLWEKSDWSTRRLLVQ